MAITFDNKVINSLFGSNVLTTAFTVGSYSGHAILVAIFAASSANGTSSTVSLVNTTGMTYNGVNMIRLTGQANAFGEANENAEMWYMIDPPVGAHNIVCTMNGTPSGNPNGYQVEAASYFATGVLSMSGGTSNTSTSASSVTVTSAVGSLVIGGGLLTESHSSTAPADSAGQTARELLPTFWSNATANSDGWSAFSEKAGAASVTISYTQTNRNHATMVGGSIDEAAAADDGTIGATLGHVTASLAGVEQPRGTIADTLAHVTASLSGLETFTGSMGATLKHVTASLSSIFADNGVLTAPIRHVQATLLGPDFGVLTARTPAVSVALLGAETIIGALDVRLPAVRAALSATGEVFGELDATLSPVQAALFGFNSPIDAQIKFVWRQEGIFIHSPFWPRERIAEITSARDLQRLYQRFAVGNASLNVSNNEADFNPRFTEGNLLVVLLGNAKPWAGPIITLERDDDGETAVNALDMAAYLDGQDSPQTRHYKNAIGSSAVVRKLLTTANRQLHTGIDLGRLYIAGPTLRDIQIGGQSVLQSLEEIRTRTGWEWQIDVDVTQTHLNARLSWLERSGNDLSDTVHLWEGTHFTKSKFKRDKSKAKVAVTAMGDFGALLAERNSVTVYGNGDKATSSAQVIRRLGRLAPGMRHARLIHAPMTGNSNELYSEARRELVEPINSSRSYNIIATKATDWSPLDIGNFVTLHFYGPPDSAVVRIVGYQPDEQGGENELIVEEALI